MTEQRRPPLRFGRFIEIIDGPFKGYFGKSEGLEYADKHNVFIVHPAVGWAHVRRCHIRILPLYSAEEEMVRQHYQKALDLYPDSYDLEEQAENQQKGEECQKQPLTS